MVKILQDMIKIVDFVLPLTRNWYKIMKFIKVGSKKIIVLFLFIKIRIIYIQRGYRQKQHFISQIIKKSYLQRRTYHNKNDDHYKSFQYSI